MVNKQINDFKEILSNYRSKRDLIDKHLYLNIFLHDEDWQIRYHVAIEGYGHETLMYDEDSNVRWYVAYNTTDKCVLEHLSNDKHSDIKNKAKERLKELYNE